MAKKIPVAKFSAEDNPLIIENIELPCYVLDTGQRVLSQSGMLKALGIKSGGSQKRGGDRLARFSSQKRLNPFISNDLLVGIETPIQFVAPNGKNALGYDAEMLQGIVRGVAKAFLQGKLQKQQEHIGQKAEALDDAFSKIGLIALIDEATGYQYDREQKELEKILKAYVSEELLPWQRRFPHDFYREIFRLRGWPYTARSIQKKPQVVGHWTNRLIYEQLPKGVLTELKKKTPKDSKGRRKHKFHQLLTLDIGNPQLQKQLVSVITLMNVSSSWREFIRLFNKKFGQQEIPFDEVEVAAPAQYDDGGLSDFNKALKRATEYDSTKAE